MKKKRLSFLLSFILMCSTAFGATLAPIREVAQKQGAEVSYTKEDGVGYVTYVYKDTTLTLNMITGEVFNEIGIKVDVAIKYENGVTYVDSEEFRGIVREQQNNKDVLENILKAIYKAINNTITAISNVNTSNKSLTSTSSSSNSSTTSSTLKACTSNIYVTTTQSVLTTTHSAIYCMLGLHIKVPGKQSFTYSMYVDGQQVNNKNLSANFGNEMIIYVVLFEPEIELTPTSSIVIETPFETYTFTGENINYLKEQDEAFINLAEKNLENKLKSLV